MLPPGGTWAACRRRLGPARAGSSLTGCNDPRALAAELADTGTDVAGEAAGYNARRTHGRACATTRCGLPFPAAKAAVLNFIAVGPAGAGDLRAWPWDSSSPAPPNASVLNYAAVAGLNVANGIVVPLCNTSTATSNLCSKDLFLRPDVSATHVVIDVLGYFAAPAATALECTIVSTSTILGSGATSFYGAPDCPAGYFLTGGGAGTNSTADTGVYVVNTLPIISAGASGWRCSQTNTNTSPRTVFCYSHCCRVPGRWLAPGRVAADGAGDCPARRRHGALPGRYALPGGDPMTRHRAGWSLLGALTLAVLLPLSAGRAQGPRPRGDRGAEMPMTGTAVPELASFDRVVGNLLAKWKVPGAAVAVVKDGRLVLARGYGWADREERRPVQPDSLFRLASLSKSLTSAAVLRLVEDGRLRLDDRAFEILKNLAPRAGARVNPDLRKITIRNLLQHSGGWDSEKSFDPMFRSRDIAQTMGVAPPAGAEAIVRYMLDQPLQFAPGTRYAYSNFGYCVLGRVIEKVTGQRYGDFVEAHVLHPAGATCMRLGHTRLADRAPQEVRYYGYPGIGLARSVFPSGPAQVPWPYGGWSIEAMDSHGGWLASAVDMARFMTSVDGRSRRQILRPPSIQQMVARPTPPLWVGADNWYGMGWQVRPAGDDANWWHMGSLDGTTTLMVRAYNGLAWVALLNFRAKNSDKLDGELDSAMWRAVERVKSWPSHDLFGRFGGCPQRPAFRVLPPA
jgi:CubicO group peptidase (beta-lactamase class C family)